MYTSSLVLTLLTAVIHATRIDENPAITTDSTKLEKPVLSTSAEVVMENNESSSFNGNYNMNDYCNNS
jgi:hypothetical protein